MSLRSLSHCFRAVACALPIFAMAPAIAPPRAEGLSPVPRIAFVIGANAAAPGRRALRYAHLDAKATAETLRRVGGFARRDVFVLLDPSPRRLLRDLDRAVARLGRRPGALLFFYYSGHADADALYPSGSRLPLRAVRTRLERAKASTRIGLIDACRGGGWTGSKGLSETDVFPVEAPVLASEGSALIASSSGLEDAHESEVLRGSFFTHHWNAGLRGAADRDGDGVVTLSEAFDYARALTIRDSALHATTPQHPSFQVRLRGRRDVPLSRLAASKTLVHVSQDEGPLELIHLGTGTVVVEVPRGRRTVRLAVEPGRYLLRRQSGGRTFAKELSVPADASIALGEPDLELVGASALATKGAERPRALGTTLGRGTVELGLAVGMRSADSVGTALGSSGGSPAGGAWWAWGITDRLEVGGAGTFAYRFGRSGSFEWLPWGGLTSLGVGYSSIEGAIVKARVGFGADFRFWLSPHTSLVLGVGFGSTDKPADPNATPPLDVPIPFGPPSPQGTRFLDSWRSRLTLAFTHTYRDLVSFNVGVLVAQNVMVEGKIPSARYLHAPALELGSTFNLGVRPMPLVRVHLGRTFSVDAYLGLTLSANEGASATLMLGTSWAF